MSEGYIKLWRKVLDNGMLRNHKLWTFWTWCLLKASHQEREQRVGNQQVTLNPGQFVFGLESASRDLNISIKSLRTALNRLEIDKNLTRQATNKYSIITICNWETYQSTENENGKQTGKQRASKGQAKGNKQECKNGRSKEEEKDSCGEPEKELASPPDKIFIELPLNDKTFFKVTESLCKEMSELFPAVDVMQEFRGMKAWLLADTKRFKTRSGIKRFYTGWLSREQNKAPKAQTSLFKEQQDAPRLNLDMIHETE